MKKSDLIRSAEICDTRRTSTYYDRDNRFFLLEFKEIAFILLFISILIFAILYLMNILDLSDFMSNNIAYNSIGFDSLLEANLAIVSLILAIFAVVVTFVSEDHYGINVGKYVLSEKSRFFNANNIIMISLLLTILFIISIIIADKFLGFIVTLLLLLLLCYFISDVIFLLNSTSTFHDEIREYCIVNVIGKRKWHPNLTKRYLHDLFKDLAKSNLLSNNLKLEDSLYLIRCLYGYYAANILSLTKKEMAVFTELDKWTRDSIRFLSRNGNIKYALILLRRVSSRLYANHYDKLTKNKITLEHITFFDFSTQFVEVLKYLNGCNIYQNSYEDLIRDNLYVYFLMQTTFNTYSPFAAGSLEDLVYISYDTIKSNTCMSSDEIDYCLKNVFLLSKEDLEGTYIRRDGQSRNDYFSEELSKKYQLMASNH